MASTVQPGAVELVRAAILNGIEQANRSICDLELGAATTLALVQIQGRTVRPYHVGDSMILVTGQRGKVKLQTVSHSPVGYAVEAGLLDEHDAITHSDRHVVSNVIGMRDMRIEIGSATTLALRDTVLLASDGLFDNLPIDQIVQHVRKGPVDTAIADLATEVRRCMIEPQADRPSKADDLTIIAFRQSAGSRER